MTRYGVALGLFFLCIAVAPFLKEFLVRLGIRSRLAYASGFALIAIGAIVFRFARG